MDKTIPPLTDLRLMRSAEVERVTARSRRSIDLLEAADDFPKRIVLGPNSVAWREIDVRAWLARRIEAGAKLRPQGATALNTAPTKPVARVVANAKTAKATKPIAKAVAPARKAARGRVAA